MRVFAAVLVFLFVPAFASAGAWNLPQGDLWLKLGGVYNFSREYFAEAPARLADGRNVELGERRPYDLEGLTRQRLMILEAEFGLLPRLMLGVQLPWYDLRFEDRVQRIDSWGWGDIRLASQVALLTEKNRLSTRVVWKLPSGKATTDPDQLPVGEGQSDLELWLQYGRSLGRPLSWLGLEAGYRWRQEDTDPDRQRDPGDEWLWHAEVGHSIPHVEEITLKLSWTGLAGGVTTTETFGETRNLRRRYQSFELGLMRESAFGIVELGWARVFSGRSYPAGHLWSISLSRSFNPTIP